MNKFSFNKTIVFAVLFAALLLFSQFASVRTTQSSELIYTSDRLIQAINAIDRQDYEEAIDLLEDYPAEEPLSNYSRYLFAQALLETGSIQRSRDVLDETLSGNGNLLLSFEKKYLEAKILRRSGDTDQALEVAASAGKNTLTDQDRAKLLELELSIASDSGDYLTALKKAVEYCEAADLRFIGEKRNRIFTRIDEIISKTDFPDGAGLKDLYSFVEILIDYGHHRRARGLILQNMDKWEGSLRNKAYFRLAWLDGIKLDFPEEARWTFNRLIARDLSNWEEARARYYLALFRNRTKTDYDLAQELLKVKKKFPRTHYGKLAARRAFEKLAKEVDLSTLDGLLEEHKSNLSRSTVRKVRWELFYRSFSDNKYSLALHYLDRLESFYESTPPEIVYWRYRTKKQSRETSEDYITLVNVQDNHPLDYYSLLAAEKGLSRNGFSLDEMWRETVTSLSKREAKIVSKDLNEPTKSILRTAIRLKNHELYLPALRRLKKIKPELSRQDYLFLKSQWESLAEMYLDSLKTANKLISLFYKHNQMPSITTFKTAFPTYYGNEVRRIAGTFGIPEALVFAVIRQESAFESKAYSTAGAEGLMQVMPATARGIAADLNMEEYQPGDGFNPSLNIQMGTYYISSQVSRWGDIRLGLAAYHGGPGNLGKWKSRFDSSDLDLFTENIPKESTKNYVKAVYRNYLVYKKLYNPEY